MVKAVIDISEGSNRILNVVKAAYGLKDKSQAINVMAREYEELVFEPNVKASYLKKLEKITKEKTIKIGSLKEFKARYHLGS